MIGTNHILKVFLHGFPHSTKTLDVHEIMNVCSFKVLGNIHQPRGVLRFELDRGVPLEPQNPYPSLRVILAEKGTHF